jgi:hypothetical protein
VSNWVYYLKEYPLGEFLIYRVEENREKTEGYFRKNPQVYHRQQGWIPDKDLLIELIKGDEIGKEDIISEEKAFARIAALSQTRQDRPDGSET